MNKVLCVYDNTRKPDDKIQDIIGEKSFGDIILKRKSLKSYCFENITKFDFITEFYDLSRCEQISLLIRNMEGLSVNTPIIHLYSCFMINDTDEFNILIQKSKYIKQNVLVMSPLPAMIMFYNVEDYIKYLKLCLSIEATNCIPENLDFDKMNTRALTDISTHDSFLKYISGGFEARFFNSIQGNDYIVTKTSTEKTKIKSEYSLYHMLPEEMKMWFVLPFNYRENENTASYSMERYQMADLGIRWVHGAISIEEFESILKRTLCFINSRHKKNVSAMEYKTIADDLYIDKLEKRVLGFKEHKLYGTFESYIQAGTDYSKFDDIILDYKNLYELVNKKIKFEPISVIGHGDLCFSNMLYNKEASILKLIDPKGALEEEQLWTNPYYDMAKLSHSICGRYDFFNRGLYEITLDESFKLNLKIDFDNTKFVNIFKNYLEENGYSYACVRLFEASLFLSMLPLHMDYPQKVLGLLLNAIEILKEVKLCMKK
ncbi:MAG: hypothetical protein ACM3KR_07250 [Deltaproteobacteria bacterium]